MRADIHRISGRLVLALEPEEAQMLETLINLAAQHRLVGERHAEFAETLLATMNYAKVE